MKLHKQEAHKLGLTAKDCESRKSQPPGWFCVFLERKSVILDMSLGEDFIMFEQHPTDLSQKAWSFLDGYIEGTPEAKKKIKLFRSETLPPFFREQFDFFKNQELATVTVVVLPDALWRKHQPTESDAENGIILVSQSYFDLAEAVKRGEGWQKELGWLSHEYGHCEKYLLDKGRYAEQAETLAYPDMPVAVYPNNQNEAHAFRRQFSWLRSQGKTEEEILEALRGEYTLEEEVFFKRVMTEIGKDTWSI